LILQKNKQTQCNFIKNENKHELKMAYENFYGIMLIGSLIIYSILQTTLIILICFNQNKFYDPQTNKKKTFKISKLKNVLEDTYNEIFKMKEYDTIKIIGTEGFYYFRFNKLILYSLFGFTVVSFLMVIYSISSPNDLKTKDISLLSVGNLNPGIFNFQNQSLSFISSFLGSFTNFLIGFVLIIFILRLRRTVVSEKENSTTVQINNLNKFCQEDYLFNHLQKQYDIKSVVIAYDLSGVIDLVTNIEELNTEYEYYDVNIKKKSHKYQFWLYDENQIEEIKLEISNKIEDLKKILNNYKNNHKLIGTGIAYATFNTIESSNLNHLKFSKFVCKTIFIKFLFKKYRIFR
jgi:hypothetical protein